MVKKKVSNFPITNKMQDVVVYNYTWKDTRFKGIHSDHPKNRKKKHMQIVKKQAISWGCNTKIEVIVNGVKVYETPDSEIEVIEEEVEDEV
jgi:hypothetical protein